MLPVELPHRKSQSDAESSLHFYPWTGDCGRSAVVAFRARSFGMAMELALLIALVAFVTFLLIHGRTKRRHEEQMQLTEAWRVVLSDPQYAHRRLYEEKLREDEVKFKKEHASLRKQEGLSEDIRTGMSDRE
jgi:hypothetical protein